MTNVLAPQVRPNPMNRRRALQRFGAVGVVLSSVTAGFNTATTKTASGVTAPTYSPRGDTQALVREIDATFQPFAARTPELETLHQRLFVREVKITWKEDTTHVTTCSEEERKKGCKPERRTETSDESASRVVVIDGGMEQLRTEYLSNLTELYQRGLAGVRRITRNDLLDLEGSTQGFDGARVGRDVFAEHFGFRWKEEEVSTFAQGLVTAGIGIPATFALLNFDRLMRATGLHERSAPSRGVGKVSALDRFEAPRTRRAVLTAVLGSVAAWAGYRTQGEYGMRSAGIREEGEGNIMRAIHRGNALQGRDLFQSAFGVDPDSLIGRSRAYVAALRQVSVGEVTRALQNGLREVDAAERALRASVPTSDDDVKVRDVTVSKDNGLDRRAVAAYVKQAHQMADALAPVIDRFARLMASGVPNALVPALRASHITDAVRGAVSAQHSSHLWGLTADLGRMYGIAAGALVATESLRGAPTRFLYNLTQASFDLIDRRRMGASAVFEHILSGIPRAERQALYADVSIQELVRDRLALTRSMAERLAQIGIVGSRSETEFVGELPEKARDLLVFQLDRLRPAQVVDVYVKKALARFTQEQLGLPGVGQAMAGKRSAERRALVPGGVELAELVRAELRQSEPSFVFDLIESGAIDDHKPNEDWADTETHELERATRYWADRIAGSFAAIQNRNVEAGLLPSSWSLRAGAPGKTIDRADVLSAFEAKIRAELGGRRRVDAMREELSMKVDTIRGRSKHVTSEDELYQRLLLKRLMEAYRAHEHLPVLFENVAHLKEAVFSAKQAP